MTKRPHTKLISLGETGAYCDPETGECQPFDSQEQTMTTAIDPVCMMEVKIETAQFKSEFQGQTYYFCAAGCLHSFEKDPHLYTAQHQ